MVNEEIYEEARKTRTEVFRLNHIKTILNMSNEEVLDAMESGDLTVSVERTFVDSYNWRKTPCDFKRYCKEFDFSVRQAKYVKDLVSGKGNVSWVLKFVERKGRHLLKDHWWRVTVRYYDEIVVNVNATKDVPYFDSSEFIGHGF